MPPVLTLAPSRKVQPPGSQQSLAMLHQRHQSCLPSSTFPPFVPCGKMVSNWNRLSPRYPLPYHLLSRWTARFAYRTPVFWCLSQRFSAAASQSGDRLPELPSYSMPL